MESDEESHLNLLEHRKQSKPVESMGNVFSKTGKSSLD
jgi:hypothetical protein